MIGFGIIPINDSCFIEYKALNATTLLIDYTTTNLICKYNKMAKISMVRSFDLQYDLGDSIEVTLDGKTPSVYEVKSILPTNNNKSFIIKSHTKTKATTFMLPLLGFNKDYFFTESFLVNCYLSPDDNRLWLIYRFVNNPVYLSLETKLSKTPGFLRRVEVSKYMTGFEFVCDTSNKELFLNGAYSCFSEKYKRDILKFHSFSEDGTTGQILFKSNKRREQLSLELDFPISEDMELYDIPNIEEEIYEYD